jgi:hypothetical protein
MFESNAVENTASCAGGSVSPTKRSFTGAAEKTTWLAQEVKCSTKQNKANMLGNLPCIAWLSRIFRLSGGWG